CLFEIPAECFVRYEYEFVEFAIVESVPDAFELSMGNVGVLIALRVLRVDCYGFGLREKELIDDAMVPLDQDIGLDRAVLAWLKKAVRESGAKIDAIGCIN